MKQIKLNNLLPFIVIGLLIIAMTYMPYGYYTFLRIIVAGYTGYLAYTYFLDEKNVSGGIFAIIGILYNPIIVIHLDREIWSVIDIVVILIFIVFMIISFVKTRKIKKLEEKKSTMSNSNEIDEAFEFESDPKYYKELEHRMKGRENKPQKKEVSGKKKEKIVKCGWYLVEREKERIYNELNDKNNELPKEIPFGSTPGSLLTKGDSVYKDKVKQDNLQVLDIKEDIKKYYMRMRDCNKFGFKKDVIEKAVLQKKVRTRLLNGKQYYHKEDVANLL